MELIGLVLMTGVALVCSTVIAVVAWFFRSTRPFSLCLWVVPPIAVISLILIRWAVVDSGPVCGPDPEWDRCPSSIANFVGWAVWLFVVLFTAGSAYLLQRILTASVNDRLRDKLLGWNESPSLSITPTANQKEKNL